MNPLDKLPTPLRWMALTAAGIFVLAVVQWITDTDKLTDAATSGAMLRWAVPIMLAGLGGLFAERAGVVNIGLEGMMILGMWFGAWGTINYGPWAGLLIGIIGGALGALVHALATVTFGVDHIISGVAILIAAPAVTRFLSLEIFDGYDGGSITQSPGLDSAGNFTFPLLAGGSLFGWDSPDFLGWLAEKGWPIIGEIADVAHGITTSVSIFTIIAYSMVPISAWVLWRTRFGLRIRIAGEHPQAGESQGINIYAYKYAGVIISGALAGFGGAFIATPELGGIYQEGSTNNQGFIGLAALIIGNWRPAGVMAGALLFAYPRALGFKDLDGDSSHALLLISAAALYVISALSYRKQKLTDMVLAAVIGSASLIWFLNSEIVDKWFVSILPFIIVLLVLTFFSQRLRMPAADGQTYRKGET